MDESGNYDLIQWFITPVRYFLKLVNDGKIAELLEKEKQLQAATSI